MEVAAPDTAERADGLPSDQSCPLERIEALIKDLEKLAKCCPKCPKGLTGK